MNLEAKPNKYQAYKLQLFDPEVVFQSELSFDYNKKTLRPEAMKTLETLGSLLAERPEAYIKIEAHSDLASPHYGTKLTRTRAEEVQAFLRQKSGLPVDHLEATGFEASCPVADNKSEEGRAANRRIEVIIVASAEALSGPCRASASQPTSTPK